MNDLSSYSGQDTENRLTSPRFKDFREALEVLFIADNISGRLKFAEAWPAAAPYVFGEELMNFDREGVQDRTRRAALELEAEERRLGLIETLEVLEEKSVVSGILQMEFVGNLIRLLGRECALYVYGGKVVDRFAPAPPLTSSDESLLEEKVRDAGFQSSEAGISETQEPFSSEEKDDFSAALQEDPLADIRPIDAGTPLLPTSADPQAAPARETVSIQFVPANKRKPGEGEQE